MKTSSPTLTGICDRAALNAASERVLFSLKACRWIQAGQEKEPAVSSADREARQIIWLSGRGLRGGIPDIGAAGGKWLAPGALWTPRAGERITAVRHEKQGGACGDNALGLELVFKGPLAADYVEFLNEKFGHLLNLPSNSPAMAAARALAAAAGKQASPEKLSHAVFKWLTSLHDVLEKRRACLKKFAHGQLDEFLLEGSAHGYSLKGLALYLGCTTSWLTAYLRHIWQCPPGRKLRELRMSYTDHLIATTNLKIADVAALCGFADAASLSKAFRRERGCTPGSIRQTSHASPRTGRPFPAKLLGENTSPPFSRELPHGRQPSCAPALSEDGTLVTVWGGAYFQCDGDVTDVGYDLPFDLSINTITQGIHWVVTLEGQAVFETGGRRLIVKPGMVVVYTSPAKGFWSTPYPQPWKRVYIKMRCAWGINALLALGAAHYWAAMLPLSSKPVRLACEFTQTWRHHISKPSITSSRLGYEWLSSWWKLLLSGKVRPVLATAPSGESAPALPDMRQAALPASFMRIKTITNYAKQIGYSRAHAVRKLKIQWLGGTPARIIRRHRLAQAALELRQTALSVAQIAKRAQFASAACFIPAFKREFGLTPLKYRHIHCYPQARNNNRRSPRLPDQTLINRV